MPRRNLAWLLGVAALTLLGAAVLYSAPTKEKDKDYEMVRLMVDTLHEVRERYVTPVDEERERQLVADMIKGGLERLDPHSTYIDPEEYKAFSRQSKGKFGGIGVHVGADAQTGGRLTVVSPMPGTPAYEGGVLAGDVILKIDGKPTDQMRLSEAVDMIQGDPGQPITLTVRHEGVAEPVDLTIVRAEIKVPSVLGDQRKAGRPRQMGLPLRQGEQDRLYPHHQLRRDDGRGDQGGRRGPGEAGRARPGHRPAQQPRRPVAVGRGDLRPVFGRRRDRQHQGPQPQGRGVDGQAGGHAAAAGRKAPHRGAD